MFRCPVTPLFRGLLTLCCVGFIRLDEMSGHDGYLS
jgi:hypothetical protein